MTDERKALIREIAFEVADVVIERHVKICPVARRVRMLIYLAAGVGIGSGSLSIGAVGKSLGWW